MDTQNRARLMDIALTLFSQQGYDAVGVQRIVEEAGVTKPTLYHYFSSKRGLLEALIEDRSAALLDAVRTASTYRGDLTKTLEATVRAYFDYAEKQPDFYRMVLSMWFAPASSEYAPIIHALLHQQTVLLETMFEAAVIDHGNMRNRAQRYALSFKGLIDTYIGVALQGFVERFTDEAVYRIVHQFMHGILS